MGGAAQAIIVTNPICAGRAARNTLSGAFVPSPTYRCYILKRDISGLVLSHAFQRRSSARLSAGARSCDARLGTLPDGHMRAGGHATLLTVITSLQCMDASPTIETL